MTGAVAQVPLMAGHRGAGVSPICRHYRADLQRAGSTRQKIVIEIQVIKLDGGPLVSVRLVMKEPHSGRSMYSCFRECRKWR